MSSISGCSLPDGKEGIKNNLIFDPYDGKDDRINMLYGLKHYYQLSRRQVYHIRVELGCYRAKKE